MADQEHFVRVGDKLFVSLAEKVSEAGEASDRGAFDTLRFDRCNRGFTLIAGTDYYGHQRRTFAFDKVEDLAAWLVDQYGPPPKPAPAKTTGQKRRSTRARSPRRR